MLVEIAGHQAPRRHLHCTLLRATKPIGRPREDGKRRTRNTSYSPPLPCSYFTTPLLAFLLKAVDVRCIKSQWNFVSTAATELCFLEGGFKATVSKYDLQHHRGRANLLLRLLLLLLLSFYNCWQPTARCITATDWAGVWNR